ncbi:N-acetylmuramoyl-L-alanine amidase-like domain-containing protein [Algoriphagus sediminis]|uniref:DUF1460 domain-containing protein n=1 Tax=Algoriphagus sediminis TaxID=3057113 RepID=A0ABT7YGI1_9BACT|nr:N-acetylmuramoyl-L-alanine amidase-like domain-containing protein [Algoriphagus sediminis]MDN3205636.1 DUF1460 domain-containing protein [Algoriphagus sediminis]
MLKIPFLLLSFFLVFNLKAQTVCTPESREIVEKSLKKLESMDTKDMSTNELAVEIGQWFLGTEYVAKTLELPGPEKLVINMVELDCTTYLESVIALTRLAKLEEYTFEAFERELELIRYRSGKNEGYPSRLHYFSDWMFTNGEKGLFLDVTEKIGGEPYENNPGFMSSNPQFYPQLSDPKNVEEIKKAEAIIAERNYFFIPKEQVEELEEKIESGDLIAITTSIDNLDMVHVGFAIEYQNRIHLLHASSGSMKVEISELPLSDYLARNKNQSGIMVSRLTSN